MAHWKTIHRLAAFLREDLRIDGALTVKQVARRYQHLDVSRNDIRKAAMLAGARKFHPRLKRAAWDRRPERYEVYYISETPPGLSVIPHLLGLAEMRTILGARVLHWERALPLDTSRQARYRTPDVICELKDLGVVSLEYDHGKYTYAEIVRKAQVARQMTRYQIWATVSHGRADFVASVLTNAEVWAVSWETGESTLVLTPQGTGLRPSHEPSNGSPTRDLSVNSLQPHETP